MQRTSVHRNGYFILLDVYDKIQAEIHVEKLRRLVKRRQTVNSPKLPHTCLTELKIYLIKKKKASKQQQEKKKKKSFSQKNKVQKEREKKKVKVF